MDKLQLTPKCYQALTLAKKYAQRFKSSYVTSDHIFLGILDLDGSTACLILEQTGLNLKTVKQQICKLLKDQSSHMTESVKLSDIGFSPKTSRIITSSGIHARKLQEDVIGTHHLILGILDEKDGLCIDIFDRLDVNVPEFKNKVYNILDIAREEDTDSLEPEFHGATSEVDSIPSGANKTLSTYTINITDLAKKGALDPIIGRDDEIDRMCQVLLRRRKNNPIIVGEPGVGKTAIVEHLAQLIVTGDVPSGLLNKKVILIDLALMIAGAKYRGQFEERLKGVLKEIKKDKDIIAFIDEIHTVIGTGNAEGALDACNIIKPALSRGELTVIGTTTLKEYRQYIESDGALSRRFQTIMVNEPELDEMIQILDLIKHNYEQYHNVKYSKETIRSIATLCDRYINDRFFPDKAIDVLDELGAKSRSRNLVREAFNEELEKKIDKCIDRKAMFIKSKEFEKAAIEKKKQDKLEVEYEQQFKAIESKSKKASRITTKNVEDLISQCTGIPAERLDTRSLRKLKTFEKEIKKNILGQDNAVRLVCNSIKRSRAGVSDENQPIGSFLFLGTTGVGKTHLAKSLAENLFGDRDNVIQLDMSEYMEGHTISKLIGSPPGYIGYDEGGILTEAVRTSPYSIILFDELEKAHQDIYNILLQILEEGRLTDSRGTEVNFKNTIIIMTSNIGANRLQGKTNMGFLGDNDSSSIESAVMDEVKKELRPELINRLDEIIVFNQLERSHLDIIVENLLKEVRSRLKQRKIYLKIDNDVKGFLIKNGVDKKNGARPLKRSLKKHLETTLADFIIENNIIQNKTIIVNMNSNNNALEFKLAPDATKKRSSNST
jgi:ATP-dependent Clp protease ATP-binding subunit ClpC